MSSNMIEIFIQIPMWMMVLITISLMFYCAEVILDVYGNYLKFKLKKLKEQKK